MICSLEVRNGRGTDVHLGMTGRLGSKIRHFEESSLRLGGYVLETGAPLREAAPDDLSQERG